MYPIQWVQKQVTLKEDHNLPSALPLQISFLRQSQTHQNLIIKKKIDKIMFKNIGQLAYPVVLPVVEFAIYFTEQQNRRNFLTSGV